MQENIQKNLLLARKNLVRFIYNQAILEGVRTTYDDTNAIINGKSDLKMTTTDIAKVVNLRHAWDFILDEGVISYPTSYHILTTINKLVQANFSTNAGWLRSVPVTIGASTYEPPIPFEAQVKEDLNLLLEKTSSYEVAIDLVLYVMKKQLFLDGNKRTAIIFANHYLISRGMGLISIPSELVNKFKILLINYYENSDLKIKDFLMDKCLIRLK